MNQSLDPISAASPAPPELPDHGRPAPAPLHDTRPIGIHPRHQHHGLLPAMQSLLYIIVIALFIITFIVQPFRIPSGSMEPTLLVGDFLLVAKQSLGFDESATLFPASAIHRGEIVIFHFPNDPALHLIKRVVGMPGDHIRLHDNHVYINGRALDEPYAIYRPGAPDPFRDNFPHLQAVNPDVTPAWWVRMHTLVDNGELIVPAGNYFVLGDNRNNSEDSRYWGLVPRANIVGTPVFIYFSLRQDEEHPTPDLSAKTLQPTPAQAASRQPGSLLNFARWNRFLRIVH